MLLLLRSNTIQLLKRNIPKAVVCLVVLSRRSSAAVAAVSPCSAACNCANTLSEMPLNTAGGRSEHSIFRVALSAPLAAAKTAEEVDTRRRPLYAGRLSPSRRASDTRSWRLSSPRRLQACGVCIQVAHRGSTSNRVGACGLTTPTK